QRFHAIHARHLQVERDHMGPELFNFLQSKAANHRRAYNFNVRVARKNSRDQLAHQSRIVDYQHAYLGPVTHAVTASMASDARPSLATTAERFRIKTTLPSPRIDAPLTNSEGAMSLSRALITSSSSPTRRSTISPNLRSPIAT